MVEGTVKFFNRMKSYGFINGDDGKTYFVHRSGLKEGVEIDENDRVSFEAVEGEKGLKAEKVEKLEKK
jgi:CspA family cold shock protein